MSELQNSHNFQGAIAALRSRWNDLAASQETMIALAESRAIRRHLINLNPRWPWLYSKYRWARFRFPRLGKLLFHVDFLFRRKRA
jgi:hypothetical protein